jgi:hypothetical protein
MYKKISMKFLRDLMILFVIVVYLFWNDDSQTVTTKLNQSQNISQMYLCLASIYTEIIPVVVQSKHLFDLKTK